MTCADVQDRLRLGEALTTDEQAHLDGCVDCAQAELELALEAPAAVSLDGVLEGLRADISDEQGALGWWRSRPTSLRRVLAGLATVGVALVFALVRPRVDLDVFPMPQMLVLVGLYGVSAAAATTMSLGTPSRPVLSPRLAWAALVGAMVLAGTLAALPPAHQAHPASLAGAGTDFIPRALGCLFVGAAVALPGMVVLGLGARATGRSIRAPWLLGGVAGAMAGQLALQLHCPIVHSPHRLVGHALLVVVLALVAVVVGRRR